MDFNIEQINEEIKRDPLVRSADLRTTHCPEYIKRFLCNMLTERENRNIGFPWSPAGVKRALSSVGGTVAAAHAVCAGPYVFSGHVAGGYVRRGCGGNAPVPVGIPRQLCDSV